MLPALAILAVFNFFPVAYAFYISFFDYDLISPPNFIGLDNYRSLLRDDAFMNSLRVTIVYVFGTCVPLWGLSLGLAMLLVRASVFSSLWRTLLFLPTVLPLVSVALVWKLLFNTSGLVNGILGIFGIDPVPWLTSAQYAPWALIGMSWWHAASYYMVIFLVGLLAIPAEYYEAAALDGAGPLARFRYITLPLLRTTFLLVVVISIINGLRTFVFQYVVTGGGPGNSTQILTLLIYQSAFDFLQMGRAAAISVVLFLFILAFSVVQLYLFRER